MYGTLRNSCREDNEGMLRANCVAWCALLVFIDAGVKLYRGVSDVPPQDKLRSETN
jgi:hypothetical protein